MLGSVPPDLDPRKKAMTLEHLISMTAGFDCDDSGERPGDEDPMQEQTAEPDWYRYSLNVPMAWNSGEKIVYCSMKPNLAAGMLEKIAGEPLPEMFYRLVAKPMRMARYHLFLQPTGQPYGGGGHHFTTRDFMKLTQLFLNDGQWEGGRSSAASGRKRRARRCEFSRRGAAKPTAISGTRSHIRIADASCTRISRAGTVGRCISGFPTSTC
jgi:CubicO group peptidase (beta-lactamase class C family)